MWSDAKLARILAASGDRIKVAGDILAYADFFFVADDQLRYDEKAFDKRLRAPGAAELLAKFKDRLAAAEPFEPAALEKLLHDFVAAEGIQTGADHSRPARSGHGQGGRSRAVRLPGDPRQGVGAGAAGEGAGGAGVA